MLKVNVGLCVAILAAHVGTRARLVFGGYVLYSSDIYTIMIKVLRSIDLKYFVRQLS